jgi:hypothetical protein
MYNIVNHGTNESQRYDAAVTCNHLSQSQFLIAKDSDKHCTQKAAINSSLLDASYRSDSTPNEATEEPFVKTDE